MLEGLRVVEYATYIAAPGCGAMFADWGADVIKVEPPGGDPLRKFFDSIGTDVASNPVFENDNRGKRAITLDTAHPDGRSILMRLAERADVFLTNVRPASLERAGLGYEAVSAHNPRLVYASVTGYGLEGPDIDRPGFDVTAFWARSGMAMLAAPRGVEPFLIRTGMGDHTTSMALAAGVLAALVERARTGKGRLVEASLMRAANYVLGADMSIVQAFGRVASTRPRHDAVQPLGNFFRGSDDRWFVLSPRLGDADWAPVCRAFGAPELQHDPRFATARGRRENKAALVAALDAAAAQFDFATLTARMDAEGLAWAPAQSGVEAANDPQLIAAGGVVETRRSDGSVPRLAGGPVRFPGVADGPKGPAPVPGEHTRAVLAEIGYGAAEIDALLAAGVAQA